MNHPEARTFSTAYNASDLPMVDINVVLKLFSLNLNRMQVFPTPNASTKRGKTANTQKKKKEVPDIKDCVDEFVKFCN